MSSHAILPIPQSRRPHPARWVVAVCLAAFAFYLTLIRAYPVLYWYDAPVRLALNEQVRLGHWLPLLQSIVYLAARLTTDLTVLRSILALVGVGAVAAAYRFGARRLSPWAGLIGAVWLAFNLMFAALAIVAYSDVLFAGLVLLALTLVDERPGSARWLGGALVLGLACLTRYEGWLLALVLIGETAWDSMRARRWTPFAWAVGGFSLAPLAWLTLGIPLDPSAPLLARLQAIVAFETGAIQQPLASTVPAYLNGAHLRAFAEQYLQLVRWQLRPELAALALGGVFFALRSPARRRVVARVLLFVFLSLLLGVSGAWEFGNLRQTLGLLVFATLFAAHGLVELAGLAARRRPAAQWIGAGMALAIALASARTTVTFVAGAAEQPTFALPARVGEWLRQNLPPDALVLTLTGNAAQPYDLAVYSHLALNNILDDGRFTPAAIKARIAAVDWVYIVALPPPPDEPLSPYESVLLAELEAGRLADRRFDLGPARVWLCRSSNWYTAEYGED